MKHMYFQFRIFRMNPRLEKINSEMIKFRNILQDHSNLDKIEDKVVIFQLKIQCRFRMSIN